MCQDTNGNGHLVLWHNGTITDLGSIGNIGIDGLDYLALALNNNGQIVTWTQATPDGTCTATAPSPTWAASTPPRSTTTA